MQRCRRGRLRRATAVCLEALEDRQLFANFVTIDNVTQSETNGSTTFRFSLTRTSDTNFITLGSPTTVSYTTQSGSASAGNDFVSQSGSVTFEAANIILIQDGSSIEASKAIAKAIPNDPRNEEIVITVIGDTNVESDETFFVNLTGITNGSFTDNQGQGTIVNDDVLQPTYSINNVSVTEGDSGTKDAVFTVTRGTNTSISSSIDFGTTEGTATGGAPSQGGSADFNLVSGTLSFSSGQTTSTISVPIRGDTTVEPNETFNVNIGFNNFDGGFNIVDTGTGTIQNDDVPPAPEITVSVQGGGGINDGQSGAINFGTITQGEPEPTRTFVVKNDGNGDLTLGTPTVPAGFSLNNTLPTTLNPGQSGTFSVTLSSESTGTRGGNVSFANNDSNENPFNFPITGTVNSPAVPEVTVSLQGGGGITDGQSGAVGFGTIVQGAPGATRTFVVKNDGNATLTLGAPSLPAGFTLTEPLAGSLGGGASDTFTVTLSSSSTGTRSGTLSFSNNDSNENPFNFPIAGNVSPATAPEITVSLQGAGSITDGQSSSVNFAAIDQGAPGSTHTFIVKNDGNATLTLGAPTLPAGFSLSEPLTGSLAAGASDSFTVTLSSTSVGTRSGTLSFSNNDSNENPFNFPIAGTVNAPPVPEITVSIQGGSGINDGQSTAVSFGTIDQGASSPTRTFVVKNDGNATLTLGAPTLPAGFSLTGALSGSLAAGASDTFTVTLASDTVGTRSGTLSFATNDSNENPFNFPITGTVNAPPVPEVTVSLQGGGTMTDGQSAVVDFGTIVQGGPGATRSFVVKNDGNATLTLGTPSLPAGFTLTGSLSSSLAAGASDTFTVTLASDAVGTASGTLSFATNDANENPFNFPITGAVNAVTAPPAPEIMVSVEGIGGTLVDGQSDIVNFGSITQGAAGATQTFIVMNDGDAVLTLGAVALPAGFTLTEALASSIDPGDSDTFTITLASDAVGTRSGTVSFGTNDANENPFDIAITGTVNSPPAPEITVLFNDDISGGGTTTPLTDGQTAELDFGGTNSGQAGPGRLFTVTNDGTAPLTLILGPLPSAYELVEGLSGSLAPGESDTFSVRLSAAGAPGVQTGTISIASDDTDENPFDVPIRGVVAEVGETLAPLAVFKVNGTPAAAGQFLDFGTRPGAAPATIMEIMVRNDGTAPLEVGQVTLPAGFNFAEPQPTSVAPGATASFKVSFTATAAGKFAGRATIPTNDPAAGAFTLAVSGIATPAPGAPPPAAINVASVTGVKVAPSFIAGDGKARASLTVTLRNDTAADFSGPVALAINASPDGFLDPEDGAALLTMTKNMNLKMGASATIRLVVPLKGAPVGAQMLLATATAGDSVSTLAGPTVTVAQPFVNLPPNIGLSPGPRKPLRFGKRGSFTLSLRNTGNVPINNTPVTYTLIVSTDAAEGGDVFQTTATGRIKLRAGGAIKRQKLNVTFAPGSFPAGSHILLVKLATDLNQTNGQVLSAIPFSIA